MEKRLLEICKKVIKENEFAQEYIAIFADCGDDTPEFKDAFFWMFKDGLKNRPLMALTYNDYLMLEKNNLIGKNFYDGDNKCQMFKFDINNIKTKIKNMGDNE